jgi:hypothetical protein
MRSDLFLVARLTPKALGGDLEWLAHEGLPFEPIDPIDFLGGADIASVFALYKDTYSRIDLRLNVRIPEALIEYNRWVLVFDEKNDARQLLAFACFKTTSFGVKLGLMTADGSERGKAALKKILRLGLTVEGVYGEVSNGVERTVAGRVPEVQPDAAARVLNKEVTADPDGRHYSRVTTNVGPKTKLMVGRPLELEGDWPAD